MLSLEIEAAADPPSDHERCSATSSSSSPLLQHSSLPTFSIRDYVFSSRSKDITTNWPFSHKNLQLCLSHGCKDILPPFQLLDSLRNPDTTSLLHKSLEGEPSSSQPSHHLTASRPAEASPQKPQCNHNLESRGAAPSPRKSMGDKHLSSPLTTQSDIVSVPTNMLPSPPRCFQVEHEAASAEHNTAAPPPSIPCKSQNIHRPLLPAKKYKLVVKLSANSDPSSSEDRASNIHAISEAMASKVCPVCRTFSSSSNTTLNAHIDQCLSVGPTPDTSMINSNQIKHKIKPRKIRLMVDIYASSQRCTLEDLDRRNGSNWAAIAAAPNAMNSLSPTQTELDSSQGKKQIELPSFSEDIGDAGGVYIDANGTKLRILSKLDDAKLASNITHVRTMNSLKGAKVCSPNNKRPHGPKHQKYLKLSSQIKNLRSSMVCPPEVQAETYGAEDRHENYESMLQNPDGQEHVKHSDSGNLRRWVRSKRSDLSKKINCGNVRVLHGQCDLLNESDQSCIGDSNGEKTLTQIHPNSLNNPVSSFEGKGKRVKDISFEALVSDKMGQSPGRKRVGGPYATRMNDNSSEGSPESLKQSGNEMGKDSSRDMCDSSMLEHPGYARNHTAFLKIRMKGNLRDPSAGTKFSRSYDVSEGMRYSAVRKNSLSTGCKTVSESRFNVNNKCSSQKNSQSEVHFVPDIGGNELEVLRSEVDKQHDMMHSYMETESKSCDKVEGIHKRARHGTENMTHQVSRGSSCLVAPRVGATTTSMCQRDEDAAGLRRSQFSSQIYDHDLGETMYSSFRGGSHDIADKFDARQTCSSEEVETCFGTAAEAPMMEKNYGDDDDAMFYADGSRSGLSDPNTHMGVDPIPIPGPPGSFLPSPRDMDSEDNRGNSSLTDSHAQSSQVQHDMVDRESSDSPVSAISNIGSHVFQDKDRSVFSGGSKETATATQRDSVLLERSILARDYSNANIGAFSGTTGEEDWLMKDRLSQGVALNCQESQLLRRRTVYSVKLPATDNLEYTRPLNDGPSSRPQNMVFPITESPAPMKPVLGTDCESPSPSPSNPVLRLMGKNLMVINKEDEASAHVRVAQPGSTSDGSNPRFLNFHGVSPRDIQNEHYSCFPPHTALPSSFMFRQAQHNAGGQCFDVGISKRDADSSADVFRNDLTGGGKLSYNLQTHRNQPNTVIMEKGVDCQYKVNEEKYSTTAVVKTTKEMIIIDDAGDCEAGGSIIDIPNCNEGFSRRYNSSFPNHIPQYQLPQKTSSPVVFRSSFPVSPLNFRQPNTSPVKWGCFKEGSAGVVVHHNHLMASSSSAGGYQRSAFHHSPT